MLGNGDGTFNPDTIKVSGLKVAICKDETATEISQHGIILPESTVRGFKGNSGTIVSIGDEATEQTGLHVGDRVKYDQCGVFHDTHPIVVLNCENIIIKLGDVDTDHIPLKNMVFAKKLGTWLSMTQSDIIIADKAEDMSIGVITAVYNEDVVVVGDKIILTTECDVINSADGRYYIYRNDQLFASIEL